jgi:hypothetical protein
MGWAEKWWWTVLILAIALVIGWEEKRCQTQAYQCRASYAAQAQSDRLRGKISINQQASEQQAIAAACEPNGYFCRLFSSANLPTMLLFFIGIGGIWAALRTLGAIRRQADLMEKSLVSVERAFVFFKGFEISRIVDPISQTATAWRFGIIWENSGTTPTRRLDIHVSWYSRTDPLPQGFDFPDLGPPGHLVVIGPKATTSTGPFDIPIATLTGVQQGTHHVYFWGRATYRDVFSNTPMHITRFCWKLFGVVGNPVAPAGDFSVQFATHSEHNCADEECRDAAPTNPN